MVHNVYAIFDHCAKAYLPPFCLRNDTQAQRAFGDCVNTKNHQFGEHPEDYTVWAIGEFDDTTGIMTANANHRNLGNGLLHVRNVPSETVEMYSPSEA